MAYPSETTIPTWLAVLDDEDLQFLRRFLLGSGSLKALAEEYGVSYPTVRARLNRLIAKVQAAEKIKETDPFEWRVRVLVADGKLDTGVARALLGAHREAMRRRNDDD